MCAKISFVYTYCCFLVSVTLRSGNFVLFVDLRVIKVKYRWTMHKPPLIQKPLGRTQVATITYYNNTLFHPFSFDKRIRFREKNSQCCPSGLRKVGGGFFVARRVGGGDGIHDWGRVPDIKPPGKRLFSTFIPSINKH